MDNHVIVKKKMNIGVDLHGVLQDMPEVFRPLLKTFRSCNHKVYVISGPTTIKIKKELDELLYEQGKHYDEILSIHDFLVEEKGVIFSIDKQGNIWTDDVTWWSSKALICEKYNIDMIIDDRIEYSKYMKNKHSPMFLHLQT